MVVDNDLDFQLDTYGSQFTWLKKEAAKLDAKMRTKELSKDEALEVFKNAEEVLRRAAFLYHEVQVFIRKHHH